MTWWSNTHDVIVKEMIEGKEGACANPFAPSTENNERGSIEQRRLERQYTRVRMRKNCGLRSEGLQVS